MELPNQSEPTAIESEIRALENAYVEILATDADPLSLKLVHKRLKELQRAAQSGKEVQPQSQEYR